MPITWPGALPDMPTIAGYAESPPVCVIETPMDVGPRKVRRRTTAGPRIVQERVMMTTTQLNAASPHGFDAFYVEDTSYGSAEWQWKNPRTGDDVALAFLLPPPVYHFLGGVNWEVTFVVEILRTV